MVCTERKKSRQLTVSSTPSPLTARPTPRSTLDHFSTSTTVITNPRSISSWVNSSLSNLYKNHVIFGICAWLYINNTLGRALSLHVYEISVILYVLYKFKNIRFYCYNYPTILYELKLRKFGLLDKRKN